MVFFILPFLAFSSGAVGAAAILGVAEGAAYAGFVYWLFSSPSHAPGPSDQDRLALAVAIENLELGRADTSTTPRRIQKLEWRLQMRQATVEQKERDAKAFPVPSFLSKSNKAGNITIAVTGAAGVGKSSFINSLRYLKNGSVGAAPVDSGEECTMRPKRYLLPNRFSVVYARAKQCFKRSSSAAAADDDQFPDGLVAEGRRVVLRKDPSKIFQVLREVSLDKWQVCELGTENVCEVAVHDMQNLLADCEVWDLPGAGTTTFRAESYVKDMGLRFFDAVIFVASKRHTEADENIIKELTGFRVPFFVVRTYVDDPVRTAREYAEEAGKDADTAEADELDKLRNAIEKRCPGVKLYLVSSSIRCWDKWDFPALRQNLSNIIHEGRDPGNDTCPVCMEIYNDEDCVRTEVDPCKHPMCTGCVKLWFKKSHACPFCREKVNKS